MRKMDCIDVSSVLTCDFFVYIMRVCIELAKYIFMSIIVNENGLRDN